MDAIKDETPSSQTERSDKRGEATSRRSVGPESESRGGPEAIDESLDDLDSGLGSADDRSER